MKLHQVSFRAKFVGLLFEFFCEREMFKGYPVNFFAKFVARGNSVQISPNFPAKRLGIYRKKNSTHLLINFKSQRK